VTQTERVLAALERAGEHGLTQVDFLPPDVIDGEKPITRLAARVKDLRDSGHRVVVAGERQSCAVYVLARNVVAIPTRPEPTPEVYAETLF